MKGVAVLLATLAGGAQAAPGGRVLVDLRDMSGWKAGASDEVGAVLRRDADGSVCLEYDFHSVSGYAVLKRALPVQWPAAFALQLRMKGQGAVNDLQVKLVDASGDNVWWVNRPAFSLPRSLTDVTFKNRHFSFAWGIAADRTLKHTETLELVIAAGQGGKGTLCVSRLRVEEREPDPAVWPEPLVRTKAGTLDLDYRRAREFNGLALQWPGAARPVSYDVLASDDGWSWRLLRQVRRGPRGFEDGFEVLFLPESEARYLRIRVAKARAAPRVQLRDAMQWPDLNAALSELARHVPRGHVPRAFLGEQNYWALVGVDGGGERSALLSEDGALEVGRGGFSVEPAVRTDDGRLVTWADVKISHSLRDGYLPMPEVRWEDRELALQIAAAAEGPAGAPQALVRYALTNTGRAARDFTLLLAVRPWQVNPPQQFLNTRGGARRIDRLQWQAPQLSVNGVAGPCFAEAPSRVTAVPGAAGIDLRALLGARALRELSDAQGQASALLQWKLRLKPGETRVVSWTAPLGGGTETPPNTEAIDARLERVAAGWRARLNRVELTVPASSQQVADTLRTALAQILMSRNGVALKPGTRAYARSWIRDGAMMVTGLVRMGEVDVARDFVDWFAGYVFESGKVPCCVDARGADPVPESDSNGEYLLAVAEVWRHSRDEAFLARHWPVVQRVVAHLESLRRSTRTAEFKAAHPSNLWGLMPASISHEGYSDKPAYSYWDDFWAVRGYESAVVIARAMGQPQAAAEWAKWRDEFQDDLARSVDATAKYFGIDTIAGAADRGDFDPSSTTVALTAQARVSPQLLQRTYDRYWEASEQRRSGASGWKDFTPYELRNVSALVRLGEPRRAQAMLQWFLRYRRPERWNQWAEVVRADAREPWFLGDMPHAWISSDYISSVLDLFAYEREADDALVLGAGLSEEWMAAGTGVKNLFTAHGPLSYRLSPVAGGYVLELAGELAPPAGGMRLAWPLPGPLPRASDDGGDELRWVGRELVLPSGPTKIRLSPEVTQ
jgi:hypothetical protein